MVASDSWREDLETWLAPFLADLTHPAQRRMCPTYIAGLIGPGDRKSIQPLAARTGDTGYDQLHHFIASGTWDAAPLERRLLGEADWLVGDAKGFLVIDDTALPKKGRASVGVAPQYASSQGKTSNCQSLVSVTLASREVPVMVGLRLFLPESWTDDPARMKRARVPAGRQEAMSKPDIAIAEIDRVMAAGVRFGCVLADAGYGSGAAFRQALSERNLLWAVGLSSRQTVYAADVELTFPTARGGRPRKYHIPDQAPVSVADMLAGETWRKVAWRRGTKGRLTCLFAARRVRVTARAHLVEARVRLDNTIRGLCATFGIRPGAGQGERFLARVQAAVAIPGLGEAVASLLRARTGLVDEIRRMDRELKAISIASPACQALMSIPGVGVQTSAAFAAAVDEAGRFKRSRTAGAYFGLVPRRHQSGELDWAGRITKQGDGTIRKLLYEAANSILTRTRQTFTLKTWALKIAKRRGLKKARVALARRLAVIMHAMLRDGTLFEA